MKFEEISRLIKGIPFMLPFQGRCLYDLILQEKTTDILELGVAHGVGTCYMAAALDELGIGKVTSVDRIDKSPVKAKPLPEELIAETGLSRYVEIFRMHSGYTWFLHDEIKRLSQNDICRQKYDLCYVDGSKNWTIDGFTFFLVDKILKDGGLIIFDDYDFAYSDSDSPETDGVKISDLSEDEKHTPHVKEIFELLVKQHPNYSELVIYDDMHWAVARKKLSVNKNYTVVYGQEFKNFFAFLKHYSKRLFQIKINK
ncbi:MAG: class I SAM-dependent methyltransferase [Candidatus Omnitrophica bacterium]|nr:class I SAM-dependent methyltransferase [Candidatus Omnitrophota bacterium]